MDLSQYLASAVAGVPDVPAAPSEGNPTDGDPIGTNATVPGAYWYYQFQEELRNLIEDEAGLTPDHENLTQLAQAINTLIAASASSDIEPGALIVWPNSTPMTGTLETDGSAISRATYAALFAEIGTKYGVGDGVTTFNIPDIRGEFIRGLDNGAGNDPDAAGRTDRGDGTTGDNVGTKQVDGYESHTHANGKAAGTNALHAPGGTVWYGAAQVTGASGGNETRPRNVNMMFCIKY